MKYSKQREFILNTVKSSCKHPTADMVYEEVRKEIPNISLGTVYRNLNYLVENGEIKKITMPNASDRFDKTLENHYHLSCVVCHMIYDIDHKKLKNIDHMVEEESGHKVLFHDIVFVGICKDCQ